jgi:hypothetical protein
LDGARAAVLLQALAEGILLEAPGQGRGGFATLRRLWRRLRGDERHRLLRRALCRDDGGTDLTREAAA